MLTAFTLLFCRLVLLAIFIWSFSGKALDVQAFQGAVAQFRLLPAKWSSVAAWIFLVAELAVVGLLIFGGGALALGFLLAVGLLILFSAALVSALRQNTRMACNCFGRDERRITNYDVARNALLVVVGCTGFLVSLGPTYELSAIHMVVTACIAAYAVVTIVNLRSVLETLRQPFRIG